MQSAAPPRTTAGDRRSFLSRIFDRLHDERLGTCPDDFQPEVVERVLARVRRIFGPGRYFEVEAQGMEKIPNAPALIVANHSGGTTIPDAWGLLHLWYQTFGTGRPIHALGHDMIFALESVGRSFAACGALRADPELARHVLAELRRDLVVMPGGDVETWRPWSQRYQLRWSGRTGYARLALAAGVPTVPIACAGAHDTLIVLSDGRWLAEKLGLYKLARARIFPIHLSLPWGLGIGPLPHFPLPARFRYLVGDPIEPLEQFEPGAPIPKEAVVAHDRRVRAAMQGLLDQLRPA